MPQAQDAAANVKKHHDHIKPVATVPDLSSTATTRKPLCMCRQPCQCTYLLEEPAVIPDVQDRPSVLPQHAGPKLQLRGLNRHLAGGQLCPQREGSRLALACYQHLQVAECAQKHADRSTNCQQCTACEFSGCYQGLTAVDTDCQCQAEGTQDCTPSWEPQGRLGRQWQTCCSPAGWLALAGR